MKVMARLFLLLTLCVFAGVASASAASVPCCASGMQDCGSDCQKNGNKAGDARSEKHKAVCDKCLCSLGAPVTYLPASNYFHGRYAPAGLLPVIGSAEVATNPPVIDNPPKSLS